MSQVYGIETPAAHTGHAQRPPARYVVIIDSQGAAVARLFLETREQVAEFDAGAEEVALMISGLAPREGAGAPEWDLALQGHSAAERRAADIYVLDA